MKAQRLTIALTAINVVILLFVLVQARSTGAQTDSSVLRGRVLEIVDERGQTRSRINVESSGEVVFRMLDARGRIRVKLGSSADGSGLVLLNDETEPGVQVLAQSTGPAVTLTGKDGQQLTLKP